MFKTIIIFILLGIIFYLILDKKNVKADDVKSFLNTLVEKIKEAIFCFGDMLNSFFSSLNERARQPKISINPAENSADENMNQNKSFDSGETQKVNVKDGALGGFFVLLFVGFFELVSFVVKIFLKLIFLILIIVVAAFAYKKTMLDFDGTYASERVVYTEKYGFCKLITYYPNYQTGNAKGFAITNISFGALFTEKVQANKNGNAPADSKEMLDAYQLRATLGDNLLVDSLAKTLLDLKKGTKSFNIGDYGKYFIFEAKDVGFENPYY